MTKTKISYLGDLKTECEHLQSGRRIETDAPKDNQGLGEHFSPTDLFAASLGSCILTIMGIYAKSRNIPLDGTIADVEKIMSTNAPRRVVKIIVRVLSPQTPTENERAILEKKGKECPVRHSLHPNIEQIITFEWGKK